MTNPKRLNDNPKDHQGETALNRPLREHCTQKYRAVVLQKRGETPMRHFPVYADHSFTKPADSACWEEDRMYDIAPILRIPGLRY